ncbi:MAG: hypothetical protein ACR2NI_01560 [Pirellulales bacterium]
MNKTGYPNYTENSYGRHPRIIDDQARRTLAAWQIPAIQKHIGNLTGKVFLDIGAGDLILGERLQETGVPKKFYIQDLSEISLDTGLQRVQSLGVDVSIFHKLVSDDFNFDEIEDAELDSAFSNSLFSHLSINSILLCLRRLRPKMKVGTCYFSSMIVLPDNSEDMVYDWHYLQTPGSEVFSYSNKDPFHYTENTIKNLQIFSTGFVVKEIHDYGHPFQKLVEFACI